MPIPSTWNSTGLAREELQKLSGSFFQGIRNGEGWRAGFTGSHKTAASRGVVPLDPAHFHSIPFPLDPWFIPLFFPTSSPEIPWNAGGTFPRRDRALPWFFPFISPPHLFSRWKIPLKHSKESRYHSWAFQDVYSQSSNWERETVDLLMFWEQEHDLGRQLG